MVVIVNNGKISYLQKLNKFDGIKAINELNKMKEEHRKHIDKKGWKKAAIDLVRSYFKICNQFGIIYKK